MNTLNPQPNTSFEDILTELDKRLTLLGSGSPVGIVASPYAGVLYVDTTTGSTYVCRSTDTTIAGTDWKTTPLSSTVNDVETATSYAGLFVDALVLRTLLNKRSPGNPSSIVNGRFHSWRRRSSSSSSHPGGNVVGPDGWNIYRASTGCSYLKGTHPEVGPIYGTLQVTRANGDSNTGVLGIEQVLLKEDVAPLKGQRVVLSVRAKMLAGCTLQNSRLTATLYSGTSQNEISKYPSVSLTSESVVCTVVMDMTPSWVTFTASGLVPTSANQLSLVIAGTHVGVGQSNDTFDITDVKLSIGNTAVGDFVAGHVEDENRKIRQRYYTNLINDGETGGQGSAGSIIMRADASGRADLWVPFPEIMRSTPTVRTINPYLSNSSARNETDGTDVPLTVSQVSRHGFRVAVTALSGSNASDLLAFQYAADCESYT